MNIYLEIGSFHFTEDENQICYNNPLKLNWGTTPLPRKGDLISIREIINNNNDIVVDYPVHNHDVSLVEVEYVYFEVFESDIKIIVNATYE